MVGEVTDGGMGEVKDGGDVPEFLVYEGLMAAQILRAVGDVDCGRWRYGRNCAE